MKSSGKATEKKLTAHLKELMREPDWWFHRFPDASVCRGRIQKQPADYLVMHKGRPALIEAKECESTTSIPKSRLTQLAKMRRFEMAGGDGLFIISHPTLNWKWRMLSILDVEQSEIKSVKLGQFKLYDLEALFDEIKKELEGWSV